MVEPLSIGLHGNEYEVMAYIRFCPMCGRNLMEEK